MIRVKKKISDDDVDRLMAASFLVDSHKNIVDGILTMGDVDINEERFKEFLDSYIDKYVYYEFLKRRVVSNYIPKTNEANYIVEWTVMYDSCTLIVTLESDKHLSKFEEEGYVIYNA